MHELWGSRCRGNLTNICCFGGFPAVCAARMCVTTCLLRVGTLIAAAAAAGTRWPKLDMPQRADVLDCAAKAAAIVECFDGQLACSDTIYYQIAE